MTSLLDHARLAARSISSSVITGADPTAVDPSNPITLFIIQLVIIIVFTQGLGYLFKYINQPKVIAEVIGGIILGKTCFGRIPGFQKHIFPDASLPYLNLVSTIGLVLFLFVVGLEVDPGVAKRNGRNSALISLAGMALPFGLGSAVAVPVYNNYVVPETPDGKTPVSFGNFLLFIGVCMSITAFPVLCRILSATKLLDTTVGVVVLSAGVGNDVVGWVLLALTLALTGEGHSHVSAVYILLAAVGWAVILLWPIRKAFVWLCRRTGSIENGPSLGMMTFTLIIVFTSSFVTSAIGVHPIFGGFLAGLIIPHEGGFAIAVTEKIEDLVTMLFLPIYFVLSGLSTDLGALNKGRDWGYIIMLLCVGFTGKFVGCAGVAKIVGYTYRESGAIGMLMSCKGLVELIVLNVGLQAGIIQAKLFSMMVLVAVLLTVLTTPGTLAIYPRRFHTRNGVLVEPQLSKKHEASRDAFLQASGGGAAGGREYTSRILVVLQKLQHVGAAMFITQLLEPANNAGKGGAAVVSNGLDQSVGSNHTEKTTSTADEHGKIATGSAKSPIQIDALKLIELTSRTYSVMQSAEKDQLLLTDDTLQLYRQFGRLRNTEITPHITIVGEENYATAVLEYSQELGTELVIAPWTIASHEHRSFEDQAASTSGDATQPSPFDGIFAADGSPVYTHFIRNLFAKSTVDVGVFIDRGISSTSPAGVGQHIFMPFFGGPDDRLALRLVVQLCHHANVTATIVRITADDHSESSDEEGTVDGHEVKKLSESAKEHQAALATNQLTIGGAKLDDQSRVISDTADNIAWQYYSEGLAASKTVLSRITFQEHKSMNRLEDSTSYAENTFISVSNERLWRPLLVVIGRGRRRAAMHDETALSEWLAARKQNPIVGAELRKTVGDNATALMLAGGRTGEASFLVCEAGA